MQPGILVQPDRPSDMSASSKSWPRSFHPLGCLAGQGWHAQLERCSPTSPRRRTTALPRPRGRPVSGLATAAPGLRSGPSSRTGSLHAGPRRAGGPVSPSPPLRLPSVAYFVAYFRGPAVASCAKKLCDVWCSPFRQRARYPPFRPPFIFVFPSPFATSPCFDSATLKSATPAVGP